MFPDCFLALFQLFCHCENFRAALISNYVLITQSFVSQCKYIILLLLFFTKSADLNLLAQSIVSVSPAGKSYTVLFNLHKAHTFVLQVAWQPTSTRAPLFHNVLGVSDFSFVCCH